MNDENIKKMIEWVENSSSFIQGEIPDLIKLYIAPKVYILKHLTSLLK